MGGGWGRGERTAPPLGLPGRPSGSCYESQVGRGLGGVHTESPGTGLGQVMLGNLWVVPVAQSVIVAQVWQAGPWGVSAE